MNYSSEFASAWAKFLQDFETQASPTIRPLLNDNHRKLAAIFFDYGKASGIRTGGLHATEAFDSALEKLHAKAKRPD